MARPLKKHVSGRASSHQPSNSSGRSRRVNAESPASAPASASVSTAATEAPSPTALVDYLVDAAQRTVLFLDLLRRRGDAMLEHERAGLPPLLAFPYETVLDAREFSSPAAYALLRILPTEPPRPDKRPVIVFDPRAGHGPGIGGFKAESEVGMALQLGHPVYFVAFFPQPMPDQTLADVHHALRRFVREVAARHPGLAPVLYGNCQAGWAVTLMSADCAGMTGPAVLNGSPLSYWAESGGASRMRLAGGLTGGTWVARLLADVADGRFDGAWLAQNFEQSNPTGALVDKFAPVLADPEAQAERFLAFERWWSGFYFFNRDEIVAIVEDLFVGNRLEQGQFQVCPCCVVDLHRIRNPLLIFASQGDDITPPPQALGWVRTVWPSTGALVAAGQRIVYLLHPAAGHLGIFMSSAVVQREHRAILAHIDAVEALAPGLYQMQLGGAGPDGVAAVRFERRRIEDLPLVDDSAAFAEMRARSESLDALYQQWLSPAIRACTSPWWAHVMKWAHPMRAERYRFASVVNPWALPVRLAADAALAHRRPVDDGNPWRRSEAELLKVIGEALERATALRDAWCEAIFAALYARPSSAAP